MGEDKLEQTGGEETIIPTTMNRRISGEGDENDAVNLVKDGGVEGSASSSAAPSLSSPSSKNKGKSCKGCLYYSSTLKSKSRNPLCVGITRSFPQGMFCLIFCLLLIATCCFYSSNFTVSDHLDHFCKSLSHVQESIELLVLFGFRTK